MKSSRYIGHLLPSICRLMAASLIITLISVASSETEANTSPVQHSFKVTTVYLVRHAEKATTPPEDPPLTEAGNARSQQLARILQKAAIKAVYTSQFLRTKQTAEPLAKSLGIMPGVLLIKMSSDNPREVSKQSIQEIVDKIHERPGEAALIVGHSNTVPEVIKMLGGDMAPAIDEKEFNDLFIVTVYDKGKA